VWTWTVCSWLRIVVLLGSQYALRLAQRPELKLTILLPLD
jgi:hypothetical protein